MDGQVEPRSIYREAWDTYRKYPASLLVPGFVLFAVFGLPAALLHETKATGIADVLLLLGIQLLGFTSSMLYYGYCEKVAAQARGGEGVSIRKALSVVKKRSSSHETAIRDFVLSSQGIKIGAPLEEYRGILAGIPTYDRVVKEIEKS